MGGNQMPARHRPCLQGFGIMAEWSRRQTRNLVGSALVGSNPADVVDLFFLAMYFICCSDIITHHASRCPRRLFVCLFRPCLKSQPAGFKARRVMLRRSYYAGVSSDRTNLSPFTKDYRGLALSCDFAVFVAREGTL